VRKNIISSLKSIDEVMLKNKTLCGYDKVHEEEEKHAQVPKFLKSVDY
jgi:hypothetical protein